MEVLQECIIYIPEEVRSIFHKEHNVRKEARNELYSQARNNIPAQEYILFRNVFT